MSLLFFPLFLLNKHYKKLLECSEEHRTWSQKNLSPYSNFFTSLAFLVISFEHKFSQGLAHYQKAHEMVIM